MSRTTIKLGQATGLVLFTGVVSVVLLLLVEGAVSTFLALRSVFDIGTEGLIAEKKHTRYDPFLGWINLPDLYIKDMYGPGIYMKTNSQSFRNDENFSMQVPHGKLRIICSGDSFTLGYGVSNHETWCHVLTEIDGRLQSVNMGQGGYGIDQAYLWYKQDGMKLDHDLQIFAFTTLDFNRMKHKKFRTYPKPILKTRDDKIVIENVPVPKLAYSAPRLIPGIKKLAIVRLRHEVTRASPRRKLSAGILEREVFTVALKVFEDLDRINKSKESTLVIVYLPMLSEYGGDEPDELREAIRLECERRGIAFVDVVADFKELPSYVEAQSMIRRDDVHYSVKGNRFVAELLYRELVSRGLLPGKLQRPIKPLTRGSSAFEGAARLSP